MAVGAFTIRSDQAPDEEKTPTWITVRVVPRALVRPGRCDVDIPGIHVLDVVREASRLLLSVETDQTLLDAREVRLAV